MLASEVPVQSVDDFVKLILISVFSTNADARYIIGEPNGSEFQAMGFEIDDYEIRAKEKKQWIKDRTKISRTRCMTIPFCIDRICLSLCPISSVQIAISDGFGNVMTLDFL